MWRVVVGALKTGEVARKYKIPGARCSCVLCGEKELETVVPFFSMPSSENNQSYSHSRISGPIRILSYLSLDKDAMGNLFILGLTPSHESKLRARMIFSVSSDYC